MAYSRDPRAAPLPLAHRPVHRQTLLAEDPFCTPTGTHRTDDLFVAVPSDDEEYDNWKIGILLILQDMVVPFCTSFFAMTLATLFRLLVFGMQLKGGRHNFDPILRFHASHFVGPVSHFSSRHGFFPEQLL